MQLAIIAKNKSRAVTVTLEIESGSPAPPDTISFNLDNPNVFNLAVDGNIAYLTPNVDARVGDQTKLNCISSFENGGKTFHQHSQVLAIIDSAA